MTCIEAKARMIELYFDDNCFGEDFVVFIDEIYEDFERELLITNSANYLRGRTDADMLQALKEVKDEI